MGIAAYSDEADSDKHVRMFRSNYANVYFFVYRTVVSGGGVPEDIDSTHVTRTYQVYRGMSPTSSNRLEVSLQPHRPVTIYRDVASDTR